MSQESSPKYYLTSAQKDQLEKELRDLYQKEFSLRQTLLQLKESNTASQEQMFLELLEVFDGLEFLIDYLRSQSEVIPPPLKRLPKSLENLQKKFLGILKQKDVEIIEFVDSKPNFEVCQVVDCESREDVEEDTITKVIRRGFTSQHKLLRPVEVIVAKKPETGSP